MKINKNIILALSILTMVSCTSKNKDNIKDKIIENNETVPIKEQNEKIESLKKNNTFYFEFDKHKISENDKHILDKHAEYLINNPSANITIEGHTDKKGTQEYNFSLGEKRANSIKSYLTNKGVNSDIISIISYGKEKLFSFEDSEIEQSKNRRAIITY